MAAAATTAYGISGLPPHREDQGDAVRVAAVLDAVLDVIPKLPCLARLHHHAFIEATIDALRIGLEDHVALRLVEGRMPAGIDVRQDLLAGGDFGEEAPAEIDGLDRAHHVECHCM